MTRATKWRSIILIIWASLGLRNNMVDISCNDN